MIADHEAQIILHPNFQLNNGIKSEHNAPTEHQLPQIERLDDRISEPNFSDNLRPDRLRGLKSGKLEHNINMDQFDRISVERSIISNCEQTESIDQGCHFIGKSLSKLHSKHHHNIINQKTLSCLARIDARSSAASRRVMKTGSQNNSVLGCNNSNSFKPCSLSNHHSVQKGVRINADSFEEEEVIEENIEVEESSDPYRNHIYYDHLPVSSIQKQQPTLPLIPNSPIIQKIPKTQDYPFDNLVSKSSLSSNDQFQMPFFPESIFQKKQEVLPFLHSDFLIKTERKEDDLAAQLQKQDGLNTILPSDQHKNGHSWDQQFFDSLNCQIYLTHQSSKPMVSHQSDQKQENVKLRKLDDLPPSDHCLQQDQMDSDHLLAFQMNPLDQAKSECEDVVVDLEKQGGTSKNYKEEEETIDQARNQLGREKKEDSKEEESKDESFNISNVSEFCKHHKGSKFISVDREDEDIVNVLNLNDDDNESSPFPFCPPPQELHPVMSPHSDTEVTRQKKDEDHSTTQLEQTKSLQKTKNQSTVSMDEEIKEEIKVDHLSGVSEDDSMNFYSRQSSAHCRNNLSPLPPPTPVERETNPNNEISRVSSRHSKASSRRNGVKFSYLAASSLSDDRWLCPICLDIYEDAVETPCCHNLFCEACISQTTDCPLCKIRVVGQLKPNIPIRRLVKELSITCPNQNCGEIKKIGDIDKHLSVCPFTSIQCPNSNLCIRVLRKNLHQHCQGECQFRIIDCILGCGVKLPLNQVDDHIKDQCLAFEILCPNNCGQSIQRRRMQNHINQTCPLEVVECPNRGESLFEEGCTYRLKRREMEHHKQICNFRRVQCQNSGCQSVIIHKDFQTHDERCLFKVIECENKCGQRVQRQELARHRQQCEFQLVRCPYYDLGCKIEILRKDYKSHLLEESFNHSIIFIEGQKRKNREIDELKGEIANLRRDYDVEIKTMFWELTRVKDHIQSLKLNPLQFRPRLDSQETNEERKTQCEKEERKSGVEQEGETMELQQKRLGSIMGRVNYSIRNQRMFGNPQVQRQNNLPLNQPVQINTFQRNMPIQKSGSQLRENSSSIQRFQPVLGRGNSNNYRSIGSGSAVLMCSANLNANQGSVESQNTLNPPSNNPSVKDPLPSPDKPPSDNQSLQQQSLINRQTRFGLEFKELSTFTTNAGLKFPYEMRRDHQNQLFNCLSIHEEEKKDQSVIRPPTRRAIDQGVRRSEGGWMQSRKEMEQTSVTDFPVLYTKTFQVSNEIGVKVDKSREERKEDERELQMRMIEQSYKNSNFIAEQLQFGQPPLNGGSNSQNNSNSSLINWWNHSFNKQEEKKKDPVKKPLKSLEDAVMSKGTEIMKEERDEENYEMDVFEEEKKQDTYSSVKSSDGYGSDRINIADILNFRPSFKGLNNDQLVSKSLPLKPLRNTREQNLCLQSSSRYSHSDSESSENGKQLIGGLQSIGMPEGVGSWENSEFNQAMLKKAIFQDKLRESKERDLKVHEQLAQCLTSQLRQISNRQINQGVSSLNSNEAVSQSPLNPPTDLLSIRNQHRLIQSTSPRCQPSSQHKNNQKEMNASNGNKLPIIGGRVEKNWFDNDSENVIYAEDDFWEIEDFWEDNRDKFHSNTAPSRPRTILRSREWGMQNGERIEIDCGAPDECGGEDIQTEKKFNRV